MSALEVNELAVEYAQRGGPPVRAVVDATLAVASR